MSDLSGISHFRVLSSASRSIKSTTGVTQVDDCFGKNRHFMSGISDTQMLRGKATHDLSLLQRKKKQRYEIKYKCPARKCKCKFVNCFLLVYFLSM